MEYHLHLFLYLTKIINNIFYMINIYIIFNNMINCYYNKKQLIFYNSEFSEK